MLGYCKNGYKLLSFEDKRIITDRNVVFDESRSKFEGIYMDGYGVSDNELEFDKIEDEDSETESHSEKDVCEEIDMDVESDSGGEGDNVDFPEIEEFEEEGNAPGVRRSTRVRVRPAYLQDYATSTKVSKFVDQCCNEFVL